DGAATTTVPVMARQHWTTKSTTRTSQWPADRYGVVVVVVDAVVDEVLAAGGSSAAAPSSPWSSASSAPGTGARREPALATEVTSSTCQRPSSRTRLMSR